MEFTVHLFLILYQGSSGIKLIPDIVFTIEKVRKKMISDNRSILVKDLGSRSELLKTNLRRVSDIARYSPVPGKYGEIIVKYGS